MMNSKLLRTGVATLVFASASPVLAQSVPASVETAQVEAAQDWGKAGLQLQWRDTSVRPGDDFARHANGKWDDTFEIPADKTSFGAFQQLAVVSEARVHAILEELVASRPAPASDEGRVVAAYAAFMDQAAIERAGLAPARPWLDRIAAARTHADLYALFAEPGIPSPIGAYVDADAKQSDRYALHLSLSGLGLPDRDYYLSDNPRFPEIRQKYKDYLALLLAESGHARPKETAEAIYALETGMARTMWDRTLLRDADLTYNKLTLAEIGRLPRGADLAAFIRANGPGAAAATSVIVAEMPPGAALLAAARITPDEARAKIGGGMPAMLDYIASQPVELWKAWTTARFLAGNAPYLPSRIDEANFAFYGKLLSGQPEQRARWKRGISVVEGQLGELLGKIYAKRHFPPASKAAMDDLVGNLRKAMGANLAELAWMGPATRAQAEAKLAAFTAKIGAPEKYKDYAGLTVSPGTALGNAMAASRWAGDFADARIGGIL